MTDSTWQSLMDAGREAYAKNRTVQAEQFFLQALGEAEKSGDQTEQVAASLNNLAAVYHTQGKYQWAEERYKAALSIQQRIFGEDSSQVATNLFNLAVLCSAKRRYSEAEDLYKQVLTLREKLFGAESPEVAGVLSRYAELLRRNERKDEAEQLEQRARAIRT